MSDFYIACKRVIGVFSLFIVLFFCFHFIITNNHLITLYLNPIYGDYMYMQRMPLWLLVFLSFLMGIIVSCIFGKFYLYKWEQLTENLSKENKALKDKFEKVKKNIATQIET